jgi:ectoine hydroxylase-related dioxygenase (phytanoyl-CoA dioxygenase family)
MKQPYDDDYCKEKARQYVEDGFCVIEQVLSADELERIRTACLTHLASLPAAHRQKQVSTGSMVDVSQVPHMAELVTHRRALDVYGRMGYRDVRFTSGYLISKPPQSPPLFWHHDWMGWAHPISYEKGPLQSFFMYYLVDTTVENGCLRVIPRTHIEEHPLHEQLRHAHAPDLSQAKDLAAPEFQSYPGEVSVCVKAGDLVIGDSRILHASHPNTSEHERPVITLWMHPNFSSMPEAIQAFATRMSQQHAAWSEADRKTLEPMRPDYHGNAKPTNASRIRERTFTRKWGEQGDRSSA